jgi:hypothetical protein
MWRATMALADQGVAAPGAAGFSIEYYSDLRTGQRLRHEYLGEVHGGHLIIGRTARSTGLICTIGGRWATLRRDRRQPRASSSTSAGRGICAGPVSLRCSVTAI